MESLRLPAPAPRMSLKCFAESSCEWWRKACDSEVLLAEDIPRVHITVDDAPPGSGHRHEENCAACSLLAFGLVTMYTKSHHININNSNYLTTINNNNTFDRFANILITLAWIG